MGVPNGRRSIKKKRFDREFKISTVKMVTEGGYKDSFGGWRLVTPRDCFCSRPYTM